MMPTPPWRRGRDADRLRASRRRSTRARLEALEGRDLLAVVLPSPTGSASAEVAPPPPPPPTPTPAPVAPPAPPAPGAVPEVASAQFEPLTGRIVVQFTADAAGYDPAVLTNPANYSFSLIQAFEAQPTKSHSRPKAGIVLPPPYQVTGVTLANPLSPGTAPTVIVSINNNEPLRFGIYGFGVRSAGLVDRDGRPLDGQFSGTFPSGTGDGNGNGDFLAVLAEVNSTVLPALPSAGAAASSSNGTTPSYVFLPSTRAFRVRYTSATPGQFMLAGGNKITLRPLSFQYFPGSYRLPKLDASTIPGARSGGRHG